MSEMEAARRKYWASQLDEAYAYMLNAAKLPVADCGQRLVSLADAACEAGVEVAFSERPDVHGQPRVYVLREGQIAGFAEAARRMNQRGWVLRVEDGYRSRSVQKDSGMAPAMFDLILNRVVWELGGQTPSPAFFFKRLLPLVAQLPRTATHIAGAAIDMSVLERGTGKEVIRGAPYLEMSDRTPMDSPFVDSQARRRRQEITAIMRESGFVEYPYEFWHYGSGEVYEESLRRTGRPVRYGPVDYDAATGQVKPIDNPDEPLNTLEDIQAAIDAALARCRERRASW
jgi:zinc D-Ala-D-Ala dipeptidase